jgi:hypothetical protein
MYRRQHYGTLLHGRIDFRGLIQAQAASTLQVRERDYQVSQDKFTNAGTRKRHGFYLND